MLGEAGGQNFLFLQGEGCQDEDGEDLSAPAFHLAVEMDGSWPSSIWISVQFLALSAVHERLRGHLAAWT